MMDSLREIVLLTSAKWSNSNSSLHPCGFWQHSSCGVRTVFVKKYFIFSGCSVKTRYLCGCKTNGKTNQIMAKNGDTGDI